MKETILAQVQQIAADIFNLPLSLITVESSPDTIDAWDSLRHLSLMLALEQNFEVEFAPEEIDQMFSIDAIISLLHEKLSEKVR